MASFTFVDQGIYTSGGDTATFQAESLSTSTITDNEADFTFEVGDAIFIGGTSVGTFAGTLLVNGNECPVVTRSGQSFVLSEDPVPTAAWPTTFSLSGLEQTDFAACFAAGTMIATPQGDCAVETLAIGDPVLTAGGGTAPVKWIGRQTLHKTFTPPERMVPVRVKSGALGPGTPHRDLVLTADHALILDGLAITAGALVNGTTIAYDAVESLPERVTYYHVETEDHAVILANGTPAETFVDTFGRRAFDNHAEYSSLYPEERTMAEMRLPRIATARLLPRTIRAAIGLPEIAQDSPLSRTA